MSKLNNIILCILGKSGSGKSRVANLLYENYGYEILQSYTTREKRFDDETGHIFVDVDTFNQLGNKVAYDIYSGNMYCATKEQIDNSDIYIVNLKGLKQLKKLYKGNKKIISVYLDVPMEVCMDRMRTRGDKECDVWERLKYDEYSFKGVKGEVDFSLNGIPNSTWFDVSGIIHRAENHENIREGVYGHY